MKKMNRKGFTIVELVIVIAVIAILAGVLIPTFSSIVDKAKKSAALQEARNAYTEMFADDIQDGTIDLKLNGAAEASTLPIAANTYGKGSVTTYTITSGNVSKFVYAASNGKTATFNGTDWSVN